MIALGFCCVGQATLAQTGRVARPAVRTRIDGIRRWQALPVLSVLLCVLSNKSDYRATISRFDAGKPFS